ncbi:uncharacterized protein [Diabrotica undecimpunctata]|uniref:uncharacterized protein n=1 Tax=Diabrotica undecimpunctata TaxID=50387 RepID=UPI003B6424E5
MAYLNESHPEVFFAIPRPGGIAKIDLPEFAQPGREIRTSKGTLVSGRTLRSTRSIRSRGSTRSKSGFPVEEFFKVSPGYTTRDYRVTTAMVSSPWVLFDNSFEFPKPPNPAQDAMDLLAITLSTVMLLAAGHAEIPKEHQRWTLSYLENVRDQFGNNPPNVRGIINHMKMLDPELKSFNDNDKVNNATEEVEAESGLETGTEPAS